LLDTFPGGSLPVVNRTVFDRPNVDRPIVLRTQVASLATKVIVSIHGPLPISRAGRRPYRRACPNSICPDSTHPFSAWLAALRLLLIAMLIAGCSSGRLRTERIFYSLEQASDRNSSFDFSVDTHCYRLELEESRSLPRLFGGACTKESQGLLLDFAAILPGDLTVVRSLRVSPDGSYVAFAGLVRSEEALLVVAIPSRSIAKPARTFTAPFAFEWLADSKRLLLVRQSEGEAPALSVASVANGAEAIMPFIPRAGGYLHIERSSRGDTIFIAERDGLSERWSALSTHEPTRPPERITSGGSRALVCDSGSQRIIAEDSPSHPGLIRILPANEQRQISLPFAATIASVDCFAHGAILTVQDGFGQKLLHLDPTLGKLTPLDFDAPWISLLPGQPYTAELLAVRLEGPALRPTRGTFAIASGAIFASALRDSASMTVERFEVLSSDGILVPVVSYSLPSQMRGDKRPILLHTYGAYGQTVSGAFRPEVAELLRQGVTYAVANIRGGGGRGATWHQGGAGRNTKKRVEDLIAVTKALKDRYRGAWVFGYGRSAGAIPFLAAAARNQELFVGLILDAPLLRPLAPNESHPTWELQEWGSYDPELDALYLLEQAKPPPTLVSYSKFDRAVSSTDVLDWAARSLSLFGASTPISLYPTLASSHAGADYSEAHNRLAARQIAFIQAVVSKTP